LELSEQRDLSSPESVNEQPISDLIDKWIPSAKNARMQSSLYQSMNKSIHESINQRIDQLILEWLRSLALLSTK
jgi:hypothetical protein